jgi:hypothetical protein
MGEIGNNSLVLSYIQESQYGGLAKMCKISVIKIHTTCIIYITFVDEHKIMLHANHVFTMKIYFLSNIIRCISPYKTVTLIKQPCNRAYDLYIILVREPSKVARMISVAGIC